jgi:hypothetical protein
VHDKRKFCRKVYLKKTATSFRMIRLYFLCILWSNIKSWISLILFANNFEICGTLVNDFCNTLNRQLRLLQCHWWFKILTKQRNKYLSSRSDELKMSSICLLKYKSFADTIWRDLETIFSVEYFFSIKFLDKFDFFFVSNPKVLLFSTLEYWDLV